MADEAPDAVAAAARRRPGHVALIAGDTSITWADLDDRVDRAAGRLRAECPEGGARVAIVLGNTVEFAVTYFGALRAGLVAVPLNPGYTPDEFAHALTDSGAALVVADEAVHGRLRSGAPPLVPPSSLASGEPPAASAGPAPDRLAVLLYTSGTSGRPKGAMLSHAALDANHEQLDRIDPPVVGPDDVVLLTVPFFHAYGLNTGLGTVAHHGGTGVLVDRFDPAGSLAAITRHRVTVAVGVPGMYAAWSRQPDARQAFAGVRTAVCGAAPLDPTDSARFTAVTGQTVIIGYGLTETAPVLTTTAVSDRTKTHAIGRPLPGISLQLRTAGGEVLWQDGSASPAEDLADLDLSVADSAGTDPGEIVVRGANLFSGYWPDGAGGPDPAGWWPTGDIAYADGDGDLHLVDRIGELILVNGFNVYPAEIERVLEAHPGVAEAAVVAAADPDTGQTPHAYVVPALDPPPTIAELQVFCAAHLARFKLPRTIELVDGLPHSATGKVRKRELT
ncbi:AMP-binding protein [Jidongwangia harbinensis]|uniref:AMP-binding protein n=1 Tax=Jidongwangia harbinensis TaxID=2878561 RepID=UPI001CD957FA|nr:AMP-binding protein [Jidongwangia harbinensis]MCA2213755.1 AMP-binding protein [Jidongwangia harbinensis]